MSEEHMIALNMLVRNDRPLAESVAKLYRRAAAVFAGEANSTADVFNGVSQKKVEVNGVTTVICTELSTGVFLQLVSQPNTPNRLMSLGKFIASEVVDSMRGNQQMRVWN